MANRDVLIINNRIETVSQVYMDNSAILCTYVTGALILHNDISDAPYDGIDIGWGWGVNDAGGNPVYRDARRGYYDHPANLVYETPTLHHGVVVAYNHIHHIKKLFHDGGAIYNLSASRDTVIAENYIHDIPDRIALYLDEGSRYLTLRDNVVDGAGTWLNINTLDDYWPLRVTTDNQATDNWYTEGEGAGVLGQVQQQPRAGQRAVEGRAHGPPPPSRLPTARVYRRASRLRSMAPGSPKNSQTFDAQPDPSGVGQPSP